MSASKMTESQLRESAKLRLEKYSHHVSFSTCVFWGGAQANFGYGAMGVGKIVTRAHRVAYALAHDLPIVTGDDSYVIRHKCDNPACVNPDHLEAGTQTDNLEDTRVRDRIKFGSKHHCSKLCETDILKIISRRGIDSQKKIAAEYGVNPSVISRVQRGKAWSRAGKVS